MGSHGDAIAIAAAAHTAVFGDSYTYTPPVGSAAAITGIPHKVMTDRRNTSLGSVEVEIRNFAVESAILASPEIGGTITIDGELWTIEKREKTGSRWMLGLLKVDISQVHRQGYQRHKR